AMPGMLPVVNEFCIEQAVRTGLGLKAQINLRSAFDRKNYFYPDLPQGYQISQFEFPIVGKGKIEITLADGTTKEIGITRLHLEQDAGKSLHDQHPNKTFVDLNRSGVALMEIVSEPDLSSPEEAAAYVKKVRNIMRYLGTCDGNMEEGNLRADVNISVRKPGGALGTRCEVKNVNSLRFIMQAIEYEAQRQVEILENGGTIDQETRLFDAGTGTTRTLRSKEEAHDYRYFPDPDLLPLNLTQAFVDDIRNNLIELPDAKKSRYQSELGLSAYDADVLSAEKDRADYFEAAAAGRDPKLTATWVINELLGALNKTGHDLDSSPVAPAALGELVDLISDQTISGKIAKDVFAEMLETGKGAKTIVADKGMQQITDPAAIAKIVDEVMAANADKVAEYRSGKDKLFGFFVGQTLKASGGKANPDLVNSILKEKLSA
ncbi:MAG TPA: Asp-tRNA(Asn)/Glu-tRNA(Gln) amidotransferase GatCAB subunit B, partial [Rhodospirillaceae bacterium]|nr:Asp-tRNA(Asn)/Glu-tRNA(Gln) amidotransferase GatCAB subunit B [Rhodospirillaceae bacterium]